MNSSIHFSHEFIAVDLFAEVPALNVLQRTRSCECGRTLPPPAISSTPHPSPIYFGLPFLKKPYIEFTFLLNFQCHFLLKYILDHLFAKFAALRAL